MTITVKYRIKDHEGAVSEDLLSWFIISVEKCRNKFECILNLCCTSKIKTVLERLYLCNLRLFNSFRIRFFSFPIP